MQIKSALKKDGFVMAKNTYIKIFVVVAAVIITIFFLGVVFVSYAIKSNVENKLLETRRGVSFLINEGYSVFSSYNGFYKLDQSGKWKLLIPDIQGGHHQEVYLCDDYLYYFELDSYTIKRTRIINVNETKTVVKTEAIPDHICVSKDNEKLAYSVEDKIYIFSIFSNNTKKYQLPSYIHSIAWTQNEGKLLVGMQEGIFKIALLDGSCEKICDGTWVFALRGSEIGYFDKKRYACFKYDLNTKEEKYLFNVDASTIGLDWSEDGKYILTAHRNRIDLIRWGIKPILHDIDRGIEFDLPIFKLYTGCVFIE